MMKFHCNLGGVNVAGFYTASTEKPGSSRLLKLWVRSPPRALKSVSFVPFVFTGRDFCDGLITRPEEYNRVCCV